MGQHATWLPDLVWTGYPHPLPRIGGWFVPFTSCVVVVQCYIDPVEYAPSVAAGVIAAQFPTRRRALGLIAALCATRYPKG